MTTIILKGVTEYNEDLEVEITTTTGKYGTGSGDSIESRKGYGRIVVKAYSECGYASTEIDLLELLTYIKHKLPEIWNKVV